MIFDAQSTLIKEEEGEGEVKKLAFCAGLHDKVPADLLPMWQKVPPGLVQQLSPDGTDVPDWVTTASAVQPHLIGEE